MSWQELLREHPGALYEAARLSGYEGREHEFAQIVEDAMWRGDIDRLDALAGCRCCCWEHTFECCPARVWGACRGQDSMTHADVRSWVEHYQRFHGMSEQEFFGG
jgi:hypothetical protein